MTAIEKITKKLSTLKPDECIADVLTKKELELFYLKCQKTQRAEIDSIPATKLIKGTVR